ncbi:MAG: hypothetical protein GOVbin4296_32 [Prokaryotic dsDNA virus sp.]|nr:MAG: hypothetical protein GOVbin4296_32 [Prokaryotic dsDNA virus sp.]|tara:strand:+ start:2118 stop:2354 length:237 start_codon:yes stop_codon:yes gene_type:complete
MQKKISSKLKQIRKHILAVDAILEEIERRVSETKSVVQSENQRMDDALRKMRERCELDIKSAKKQGLIPKGGWNAKTK